MKKNAKTKAELVPAEAGEVRDVTPVASERSATVALVQHVALSATTSAGEMAAQIQADMDRYERMSREAALIALRVGLRLIWIRDNEAYGSLAQFTDQYFANKSRRTLFNYIRVADDFLNVTGLRDRKTHKLTGKALDAVAPVCAVQLELFSDPQATLEGALKKVVNWLGDRGLAQIYRELETRRSENMPPRSPGRPKKATGPEAEGITIAMRREVAQECLGQLVVFRQGESWQCLEDDDMAWLDRELDEFHAGVAALMAARKAAEAAKPQPRRRR